MGVRHPAVAGSFYPGSERELRATVQALLSEATPTTCHPKAIIAPHAGYIYSGLTAAFAYKSIIQFKDVISKVVLLGPSHRVGFKGIAAPDSTTFETPLGAIDLDQKSIEHALSLPQVIKREDAHFLEHSLEVQLPFLQTVLGNFLLVPFVVGDASTQDVAELLELVWGDQSTLIVISSDLSHYHPYQDAKIIDAATSETIEKLDPVLVGEQACGCRPINGLLASAKQHNLHVIKLDIRNSGDTAGNKEGVVGYGAYALQ